MYEHLLFEADCIQYAACDGKHLSLISVLMEEVEVIMGCMNIMSMHAGMYASNASAWGHEYVLVFGSLEQLQQ